MTVNPLVLRNGELSLTFVPVAGGWRPEWLRLGARPMLRLTDHEFLRIGAERITTGELRVQRADALCFGGSVLFAGVRLGWSVAFSVPTDGGGLVCQTELAALQEPVELLEALTTFELPYEYDGSEHSTVVMPQQPIYRYRGQERLSGAGYEHPFWYYGRVGRAHLTFETQTPVVCSQTVGADGGNERCITLIGDWHTGAFRDLFTLPTRDLRAGESTSCPDPALREAPGRRGRKFLVGALNWNASLHKDPNVLLEPGHPWRQTVLVDAAGSLPGGRWDTWLAAAWERCARRHLPADGYVPALHVAQARGATWIAAAEWLGAQFQRPEGCPGFFNPERGVQVYAPHTRPRWDHGVGEFCGQWLGPLAFLSHVWQDAGIRRGADRLEPLFVADRNHSPETIWTIGPTPMHVSAMRKALLCGVSDGVREKVQDYVVRRSRYLLDPPAGAKRGDGGILAWDAYCNLLAAELFDRTAHEAVAKAMLAQVRQRLEARWESFNCAAEGDLVGAGQGRPFGHGVAATACILAAERFGDRSYLELAERCGNITLGLYYAAANLSPVPDMDTRGWAVGANGGRDQLCHMPPWETGFGLQQLAWLIEAGLGRPGFYDALWSFAHTGLCMFPRARALKRVYTHDLQAVYRPIEQLASEREFYLSLPFMAYEEPWDQTMLAGYQGVEPLLLCLGLGGGLAAATDERVLALVPRAMMYDATVAERFTVQLWNPLAEPVETRLHLTVAARTRRAWQVNGVAVDPAQPLSAPLTVPPRQVLKVACQRS
jgi:hypothetical protein